MAEENENIENGEGEASKQDSVAQNRAGTRRDESGFYP